MTSGHETGSGRGGGSFLRRRRRSAAAIVLAAGTLLAAGCGRSDPGDAGPPDAEMVRHADAWLGEGEAAEGLREDLVLRLRARSLSDQDRAAVLSRCAATLRPDEDPARTRRAAEMLLAAAHAGRLADRRAERAANVGDVAAAFGADDAARLSRLLSAGRTPPDEVLRVAAIAADRHPALLLGLVDYAARGEDELRTAFTAVSAGVADPARRHGAPPLFLVAPSIPNTPAEGGAWSPHDVRPLLAWCRSVAGTGDDAATLLREQADRMERPTDAYALWLLARLRPDDADVDRLIERSAEEHVTRLAEAGGEPTFDGVPGNLEETLLTLLLNRGRFAAADPLVHACLQSEGRAAWVAKGALLRQPEGVARRSRDALLENVLASRDPELLGLTSFLLEAGVERDRLARLILEHRDADPLLLASALLDASVRDEAAARRMLEQADALARERATLPSNAPAGAVGRAVLREGYTLGAYGACWNDPVTTTRRLVDLLAWAEARGLRKVSGAERMMAAMLDRGLLEPVMVGEAVKERPAGLLADLLLAAAADDPRRGADHVAALRALGAAAERTPEERERARRLARIAERVGGKAE